MEIGAINEKPLTKEDYQKLRKSKACFFCRKPNAGHYARDCPLKRQRNGKGRRTVSWLAILVVPTREKMT